MPTIREYISHFIPLMCDARILLKWKIFHAIQNVNFEKRPFRLSAPNDVNDDGESVVFSKSPLHLSPRYCLRNVTPAESVTLSRVVIINGRVRNDNTKKRFVRSKDYRSVVTQHRPETPGKMHRESRVYQTDYPAATDYFVGLHTDRRGPAILIKFYRDFRCHGI